MLRSQTLLLTLWLTILAAACTAVPATPSAVATEIPTSMGPAVVRSIEIQILESSPVQVNAVLRGDLPDAGCTKIASVDQVREGNLFRLTLVTVTDPLAKCAAAITPFEQVVGLDVKQLPTGSYTVRADAAEATFEFKDTDSGAPAGTDKVEYVMAQQNIMIHTGPASDAALAGQVSAGQVTQVTGLSPDGMWWQIVCPDKSTGECWISADPALTLPTTALAEEQPKPAGTPQTTDVKFVIAQRDVPIYNEPGDKHPSIGTLTAGQTAQVVGISADGSWWQVACPQGSSGDCWVSADPAFTQPSEGMVATPTGDGSVQSTDVQYIMAQQELVIRSGPGEEFSAIGNIAAGQTGQVTGVSIDGNWWRVICPDSSVGNCWVAADPILSQPAKGP